MSVLVGIITSSDSSVRDQPIEAFCQNATPEELLYECAVLERFRHQSDNLYQRVRSLFFLAAIHRYHLPPKLPVGHTRLVPYEGYAQLLRRRYEEAIRIFLTSQSSGGPAESLSSALAMGYRGLAFQTLADQVRRSVRSVRGNQWMFRVGHVSDYPLRLRPELLEKSDGAFPVLAEATPVRMDLSHSGWSDIFFLGMDFPEGARVLNVSIDLAVRSDASEQPEPPVEACFRVIDEPVLRLVSVDLQASVDLTSLSEVFDFARDYLGLLKAAVVASGMVPPGFEGSGQPLEGLLEQLTGQRGHGIELVSRVKGIPKGSRLAVSTNLLAGLISACMRATKQIRSLTGPLDEHERRTVAARAILGEWLGGSGGGWQDSGGVWPGIKLIEGVLAAPADVEHGVSRGCLLPRHRVLDRSAVPDQTRQLIQDSLVLVHGGMAQDVGPILEMVTEKYLLRSAAEWHGRKEAMQIIDSILQALQYGDVSSIGAATQRNFEGPIQTIIPWAGNKYTAELIARVRTTFGSGFHGFCMLGGMAGGGMGFFFDPSVKLAAQKQLATIMSEVKRELESGVPFAIEPVVYDFRINENGTFATLRSGTEALMPSGYYTLTLPTLLRHELRDLTAARRAELEHFGAACQSQPGLSGMASRLIDHLLPKSAGTGKAGEDDLDALLEANGFDRVQHERIRGDLRAGRIGLSQNALPVTSRIEDVKPGEIVDARTGLPADTSALGHEALRLGSVAVFSLAGGAGSRWTRGAGVVKALNPF
ncbi:MAG TPA: UTP--glucose-1-phosphate uridylyltransferase, partial [Bryobacteraceae bacterium]|nr:UTP--glucose-1-phosphate uridylyltransferase [Bryobacteraceae bacterium]